ncbi:ABC transporter substrate-binding protein [Aureimonas altamirensis]|uniref:Peptide/nickel transport system substrate-binding protein n=1 Tax=Aureimonas altamirensis DSM 21988 TaxID=1121026 RepID=A0ABY1IND5_9HYPH|nr:ABC transporter substrate-binding protein [Aureimonas altamirensis]SHJ57010.1 peptide/nickel transport system substrate-binding protein [Aureimonas altamirensis DSM 21988]
MKNDVLTDALGLSRRALLLGSAGMLAVGALGGRARAQEMTPKRGGHLVFGLDTASSSDSIDPAFYTESYMYTVGFQLFNTLVEIGESSELVPSLAESWEPTRPDGSEWRFKIRKGVQFHNGKELDANDVIYSINHHRGPDSKSGAKGSLEAITEIKATGPMEVTITLVGGNADFPYTLTDYHLGIGPDGGDFTKGIGTGAYTLETFQPGVRALTKRFENHWNPDRGFVDSCETLAMSDPTARMAALVSGQVHIINRVDPKMAGRLASMSGVKVFSTPANTMYCFPMRCDMAPFDNVDMRQAMKHAIDREIILKNGYGGAGIVGNDTPIPNWSPYYSADVPKNSYDPDKARSLIQKAGFSGPIELSVSDNGFPGSVDAAQLFRNSASAAGIDITVNRVPSDGYWDEVWMKKPFCASNWSVRPTVDAMLSLILQTGAPWNETYWSNPAFDQLIISARAELDETKRKAIYHDAQVILAQEAGELIPIFVDQQNASTDRIQGIKGIPGGGDMGGYRLSEKVWFES